MSALAGLETGRQRRLAEDFAMNRYFRRDVFARHTSEVADGRELGRVVVGRIDAEAPLQPEIRVPRGVVSFQRSFAEEVRELMSRGSMSIDDVAAALCGAPERAAAEIVRNVTFLVAAGVLTPFAQARGYEARSGQRRWANTIVQKTLDHAVEHRVARVLPSQVLGNGLEIEPLEALAIREMMAGTMRREELSARLLKEAQLDADGERASGPQPADPSSIADSLAKRAVYDVWPKLARLGLLF